jgi:hypothetical protein
MVTHKVTFGDFLAHSTAKHGKKKNIISVSYNTFDSRCDPQQEGWKIAGSSCCLCIRIG